MKISPVVAELFHADRRTDKQDEAILFFGPCIFNNEDKKNKNKPTKCTN